MNYNLDRRNIEDEKNVNFILGGQAIDFCFILMERHI